VCVGGGLQKLVPVYITGAARLGPFKNLLSVRSYLVHFLGKDMDSKTVTVTALVNSLEAFLIHVV
jgi:hypothetical protein